MSHPRSGPLSITCEVKKWVTVPQSDLAPRERWLPAKQNLKAPVAEQLCDVFRWAMITVDEALGSDEPKRCVECKQAVRPRKARTNGVAAHFEHVTSNPECSLSGRAAS